MRLMAESCWELVIGEEETPNPPVLADGASRAMESAHTIALKEFKADATDFARRAGKAASIINSTLSSGVEFYVKDTINPIDMWTILRNKLTLVDNWGLQRTLKRDFYKMCYDGKESITTYINHLRGFQQQLQGTNNEISNDELVNRIMTSLPASWEQRIITLDDKRDLTLDDLERALRSHQAKQADVPTQATKALAVARHGTWARGNPHRGRCRGGRANDRRSSSCSTKSCWYCLKAGHSQNDCFMRKKAEEARRDRMKRQSTKESDTHVSSANISRANAHALMTKRGSVVYSVGDWFIDSGATDHMCNDYEDFFALKRLSSPIRVVLGDDTVVFAYGVGSIKLTPQIVLNRVLFVPDLGTKLLSVSVITQLEYQVIFDQSGCRIWKDDTNILSASQHGNLFKVDLARVNLTRSEQEGNTDTVIPTTILTQIEEQDLQLWHQRLGHLNISDVHRLEHLGTGLTIKKSNASFGVCSACLEGKQQRSFNRKHQSSRTLQKLELIHSDSCGPLPVLSLAGA